MIIIPQVITLTWNVKTKGYYESLGYVYTNKGDQFEVNIFDLPNKSNLNIKCICDYCGSEVLRRFACVSSYLHSNEPYKIACNNCTSRKVKDTNIERYGVAVPLQSEEIKSKVKQTCIDRYGVEYSGQAQIKKKKTKQTNLKKYGVEYTLQREDIREQIKQTNLEKYGVENPLQNNDIKEKVKQTNLERYGVEYTWQNEEIKEKIKQVNLDKYGVEYTLQSEEIKQKSRQTNLKKYGVEYVLQSDEIKEKGRQTNLRKYGVEHNMQRPDVQQKAFNTMYQKQNSPCSKQQKYLWNLLGGELNYPLGNCKLDIAFLDEQICIEYNGGGHDLQVKKGYITQEEFNQKELKRDKFIKANNWKIIKIIAVNDKLPNDKVIIELINQAKQHLLNSKHTWYIIDIDNSKLEYANNIQNIDLGKLKNIYRNP